MMTSARRTNLPCSSLVGEPGLSQQAEQPRRRGRGWAGSRWNEKWAVSLDDIILRFAFIFSW